MLAEQFLDNGTTIQAFTEVADDYCAGRAGIKQLNDLLREKQQRDWQVRESEKEVVRLQKRIPELDETVVKWETRKQYKSQALPD